MLCIFPFVSYAQGEIDSEQKLLYRNEISWSLGIQSNGIGAGFRYGTHQDRLHRKIYDFQILTIHHPKEIKISSSTGRMVYGKLNNAYAITGSLGKQIEKYSKLDKGSVSISYVYDGGFALGIEKPIYYYVDYPDKVERFNTSNHTKYGKAPFVFGLDEMQVIPGVFAKSCVQFEFSRYDREIRAIEVGVAIQAYIRKIEIMYIDDNAWLFPSFYIHYRMGKILSN